jgi:hypothetical protein
LSTSAVLAPLSQSQTASPDRNDSSGSDDSGRIEEHFDQTAKPRDTGEADEELIDTDPSELTRQKRKIASNDAAADHPISTRLERLADLPMSADTQSFIRELARLFDGTQAGATWLGEQTAAPVLSDDGLIELLAADISSLMLPPAGISAGAPVAAVRAASLEGGVALYQAFEVATGDAASARDATTPQIVDRPSAEPGEQLARVD